MLYTGTGTYVNAMAGWPSWPCCPGIIRLWGLELPTTGVGIIMGGGGDMAPVGLTKPGRMGWKPMAELLGV